MSLVGAVKFQELASSNSISAQVHSLIEEKKFNQLHELIKGCRKSSYAPEIYQAIFGHWLPRCWLTFLRNPRLNATLEPKHLIEIVGKAHSAICNEKLAQEHKKYYHLVLVAMARNAEWCRMLSYSFFLDYVSTSKPLLEHAIYDIEFMTHLDYTHMCKLFNFITEADEQNVVLEYLEDLLDNNKSSLHRWALEAAKYMFIHCQGLDKTLLASSCETMIEKLKSAFMNDKLFAVNVLKRPHLYPFFDLAALQAKQHPLLDLEDYQEIMLHLQKAEPVLALDYALQITTPIQQAYISVSMVAGMTALTFTDTQEMQAVAKPISGQESIESTSKKRSECRFD